MLKLIDNPPMRRDISHRLADFGGDWWVAHTKARNEKALAWDLNHLGIEYYLPMLEHETFSGGRKRRTLQPLFTSYLFFAGGPMERYRTLTTNRVANVIPVVERDRFICELSAIEAAIDAGQTLQLYPKIEAGQRCRIFRGPMEGQEGTVVRVNGVERVFLFISILGVGAELQTHSDHLELIDY